MTYNIISPPSISVKDSPFFAKGDGTTNDVAAINAANAAATAAGASIFFTAGTYHIPSNITLTAPLEMAPGAVLSTANATVTISNSLAANYENQQIFAGTGFVSSVTQIGGGPAVTITGAPLGAYDFTITITSSATLGTATFSYYYLIDSEILTPSTGNVTASTFPLTGTGLTLNFASGSYVSGTAYSFTATPVVTFPAFTLGYACSPKWWGALGNGTHDDTNAVQAAFTAAQGIQSANKILIPYGFYILTNSIVFENCPNGDIYGNGAIFIWQGGFDATYQNPIPAFDIRSCQGVVVHGIGITAGNPYRLAEGFRLSTKTNNKAYVSSACSFYDIGVAGNTNEVELCVRIGGGANANNDFHKFYGCNFANFGNAAVEVQDNQVYQVILTGCRFLGLYEATNIGTMSASSATLTHDGSLGVKDIGKYIEVTQTDTSILRATIVSVTDSTHVVLSATSTVGAGPNAPVLAGSQCCIRSGALHTSDVPGNGDGGSYTVIGGGGGGVLYSSYVGTAFNAGPITLRDNIDEDSRCYFTQLGISSGNKVIVIENCRISASGGVAYAPETLVFDFTSHIVMKDTFIGDPDNAVIVKIGNNNGGFPGYRFFSMVGCTISSIYGPAQIFEAGWPTTVRDSFHSQPIAGGGRWELADHAQYNEVSGTFYAITGYKTLFVQIDGNVTFNFSDNFGTGMLNGYGGRLRMFIRQNLDGPFTITWPANVVWLGGGAPTIPIANDIATYSIIDFHSAEDYATYSLDGYTVYGNVISGPQNDRINVLDFGATGNGTTDDTAAIQASVTANPGLTYFPSGTYKITSTVSMNSSGIFRGESAATTTIIGTTPSMTMLEPNVNGSFTFEDLTFNMNGNVFLGFSGDGVLFNDVTFRRCNFINCNGYAIIVQDGARLTVEECLFDGAGKNAANGIGIVGNFDTVNISQCTFRGLSNGIEIASDTTQVTIDNVTVQDCLFDGMYYTAPALAGITGSGPLTQISSSSGGMSLPQSTVNVISTVGFASSGTVIVATDAGNQIVTYGSTSSNKFLSCSGGTGLMTTGNAVSTVAYTASSITDLAQNFTVTGTEQPSTLTQYGYIRAMTVRATGTVTAAQRTQLIDSSASFLSDSIVPGDVIRAGSYFAIIKSVESNIRLNIEEWLSNTDRTFVSGPATTQAYTVYGILLMKVGNSPGIIGNTLAAYGSWCDLYGNYTFPAAGTLYEGVPISNYPFDTLTNIRRIKVLGNTIRRSYSDSISIFGDNAIIAHNTIQDGQDVGVTLGGNNGQHIVHDNLFVRQGTAAIFAGAGSDIDIHDNTVLGWGAKELTTSIGDAIGIEGPFGFKIHNNTIDGYNVSGPYPNAAVGIALASTSGGTINDNVVLNLNGLGEDIGYGTGVTGCSIRHITASVVPSGGNAGQLIDVKGSGSPASVVSASPGSTYLDTTNGNMYIKHTGTGTSGWQLVTAS